ncbi:MAG: 2'-5' RNA ligase [Candidatus Omnitrophica bacterium CG1_02_44_16]|nr:MAG: 2'-5' RNA ligase [Candidatus Omnitrophica bacterium CG1_02_44_16]PIY83634.1 MAG: RNA 2',3'-cyclic phosphodiesterase [Candidatus Omnitrophica bacterium CG_4_10_14_0_8_um_filter_44_12]PIZ84455.1 MAG: RNA 2',3'-cyclic phosphodiesterase [Candidatus Omnitrophica bacterium CG_4_10_14_0_2_um_filter_44_9]
MPLKRLFIATELPPDVKKRLQSIQNELKKFGPDVKWVEPKNIHLTIKFLGNVEAKVSEKIGKLLEKDFSLNKSFKVTLDRIGCFPSLQAPRILWAGFEDKQNNSKKIARLLGNPLSDREFQLHATLGRFRSSYEITAFIEQIKKLNLTFKPYDFFIDNITLFESRLSAKGPAYTILHGVKFLM